LGSIFGLQRVATVVVAVGEGGRGLEISVGSCGITIGITIGHLTLPSAGWLPKLDGTGVLDTVFSVLKAFGADWLSVSWS
jgi:hypothetical protein